VSVRGRRTGGEDTRAGIIAAARVQFAQKGYDGTSLRGIARAAGVDPALVHHYFEGKAHLFTETMQVPAQLATLDAAIMDGPREAIGERTVRAFFSIWEVPAAREGLVAVIRSAVSHDDAARMLREFLAREPFGRLGEALGTPDAELRAGAAAAQMLGLAVLRYVIGYEPLVNATEEELVALVAPTVQRYLSG